MRMVKSLLVFLICIGWIWALDRPFGTIPAIGRLLDPVNGFWANAVDEKEPASSIDIPDKYLKQPVKVYLDERLVPHVTAMNDQDLYFAQVYLHAY